MLGLPLVEWSISIALVMVDSRVKELRKSWRLNGFGCSLLSAGKMLKGHRRCVYADYLSVLADVNDANLPERCALAS